MHMPVVLFCFPSSGGDERIQHSPVLIIITNPPWNDDEQIPELSVSIGNDWVNGMDEVGIGWCHQSARDNSIPCHERTEPECRLSVYVALRY